MQINNPTQKISGVLCNAINCAYNDGHGCCQAKQIEIGPMQATSSNETVCATFRPDPESAESKIF